MVLISLRYTFPLEEKAAVFGFEAQIDGKKVVGKVHDKEEATNVYDDAISQGHGAYLLEKKSQDLFTANIGNLPPNKGTLLNNLRSTVSVLNRIIRGQCDDQIYDRVVHGWCLSCVLAAHIDRNCYAAAPTITWVSLVFIFNNNINVIDPIMVSTRL